MRRSPLFHIRVIIIHRRLANDAIFIRLRRRGTREPFGQVIYGPRRYRRRV